MASKRSKSIAKLALKGKACLSILNSSVEICDPQSAVCIVCWMVYDYLPRFCFCLWESKLRREVVTRAFHINFRPEFYEWFVLFCSVELLLMLKWFCLHSNYYSCFGFADILSKGKVDSLDVEKASDKCMKWVISLGTTESSPVVPTPCRLVDYSPSLTSASSRM